uniref:Uncharacterized protein n=1 Tax=Pyramimonas obovata TaxID=1411642 RepID=A0A7S0WQ28_9CHLO|mmetsp:Transcript_34150/g.74677  ORF Transcript_34150/g.74677 Transcript_34150/m.74677 type:complete len:144 (+) Transcript_34150:53-484(+)
MWKAMKPAVLKQAVLEQDQAAGFPGAAAGVERTSNRSLHSAPGVAGLRDIEVDVSDLRSSNTDATTPDTPDSMRVNMFPSRNPSKLRPASRDKWPAPGQLGVEMMSNPLAHDDEPNGEPSTSADAHAPLPPRPPSFKGQAGGA